jgi:hypothetical protein
MRKKQLGYITVSALLLAAVSGLAVAQAATDITAPETIVLISHNVKEADVNVGDKAFGPGDSFMYLAKSFDETDQTQLGSSHVQCTIQPGKGWELCTGAFIIDGRGQIVGQGVVRFTQETTSLDVPITGGTGDFANVRGYVHVDFIDETTEKDTLNLLP